MENRNKGDNSSALQKSRRFYNEREKPLAFAAAGKPGHKWHCCRLGGWSRREVGLYLY